MESSTTTVIVIQEKFSTFTDLVKQEKASSYLVGGDPMVNP